MPGYRNKRFTIYDMMEDKGVFARNTANASAYDDTTGQSTYAGPVEYPKMLFHPEGLERITVPAEIIMTPLGPQRVGEQKELIYVVVENAKEERRYRHDGWHGHPRDARAAAGKETATVTPDQRISELEAKIRLLQAEQQDAMAEVLPKAGQTIGRSPPTPKAPPSNLKGADLAPPLSPDPGH